VQILIVCQLVEGSAEGRGGTKPLLPFAPQAEAAWKSGEEGLAICECLSTALAGKGPASLRRHEDDCHIPSLHLKGSSMPVNIGHKRNFNTLRRAFLAGNAVLMECQSTATGKPVAVICAANRLADGGIDFVPFATMFGANPYTAVNPPSPDGGFFPQEGQREI
jgi:hypothetical protein